MPPKLVSQRTLVSVMRALREHGTAAHELEEPPGLGELLYENDFPDWFVTHSRSQYSFDWKQILPALRNTQFFFPHTYFGGPGTNITGKPYIGKDEAAATGEWLLQRLAALASKLPEGEDVARSLEFDGFQVDQKNLQLVPLDSVTSEREEEERVAPRQSKRPGKFGRDPEAPPGRSWSLPAAKGPSIDWRSTKFCAGATGRNRR